MDLTIWIVLRIILIIALFVLALSIIQFIVNIHPPRFFDDDNPSNYGLEYEDISFKTSDEINISAWLISSEKADGTVIVGHGYPFNKGNILHVALFLYPKYNLLFYDHRYFGQSSGRISTVGLREVEDVKAALRFVKKRFGNRPVAFYGFSISASTMLMSKQNVSAIISDSAYANLENMVNQVFKIFGPFRYPFVELTNLLSLITFKVHPREVSPAKDIKDSETPIFVIHGNKDSQIPVEEAYLIKESKPDVELWIVENADHGQAYALYSSEYKKKVRSFLAKHMNS